MDFICSAWDCQKEYINLSAIPKLGLSIIFNENDIAGSCTVAKRDCIPNVSYTPYIGYMFVDEKYRGQRLSQRLISYAMSYLPTQGFHQVYLVSDHENYYEKYGFKVIDKKMAPWGKCHYHLLYSFSKICSSVLERLFTYLHNAAALGSAVKYNAIICLHTTRLPSAKGQLQDEHVPMDFHETTFRSL